MDKSWMEENRLTDKYVNGAKEFVRFAAENARDRNKIICPCLHCCYGKTLNESKLLDHLVINGIDKSYTCWTRHGERFVIPGDVGCTSSSPLQQSTPLQEIDNEDFMPDRLEDMTAVIEEAALPQDKNFENLKHDSNRALYDGCKFSLLKAVLCLYKLKANNSWSEKSFTDLLGLLKDILPEGNHLPVRTYEAKKMLSSIGMGYERIHACGNDCILYRKEYASLKACPKCGEPRYKKKGSSTPVKTMWYLPIIPRFRRMYNTPDLARDLTWHSDRKVNNVDGKVRHPSDSPQWKHIDNDFPGFGDEQRNLRLVLATDGMNPHGMQSSSHSTWPVLLIIYNLPPSRCMKRDHIMMPILISGPKQPGNDIDVYLSPLIDDLKFMWESGVVVYDGFRKEHFNLKAVLFGTINDFPARANLDGYGVHGQFACPICIDNTNQYRLPHSQKYSFRGHRRWLPRSHRYRKWKTAFNGMVEEATAPPLVTSDEVFERVKDLNTNFGKSYTSELPKTGWKKRSIFFDLPYWRSLPVRHFLDLMHIEKNVFDSIIGTLLNVQGKTKDGIKARNDLVAMGMRGELHPSNRGTRTILPPAAYTLSRKEKIALCQCLKGVRVPEGYSSNISSLVSMKDLKLKNPKTHDCHVIMDHLLPIAIRGILPNKVRESITSLCFFFKAMWSKVFDPDHYLALRDQIAVALCELEMYFPPAFFDIMMHLPIHLVQETQLCGPPFLRSMYPVERYMKVLKGYVKNRQKPEGCIVERYIVDEAISFCTDFLGVDISTANNESETGNDDGGRRGRTLVSIPETERAQAHLYVIHNTPEIEQYVVQHKEELTSSNPNKNESWILKEHNKKFATWFKLRVNSLSNVANNSVPTLLKQVAVGPGQAVFQYSSYRINGRTFCTREHDERSTTQNSGVTLKGEAMHRSSAKDKHPVIGTLTYFGYIEKILELDYGTFWVPIFRCKWADNKNGVQTDDRFTRVNFARAGYTDEPFILASQARKVFYIADPIDEAWDIVLSAKETLCDTDVELENEGDEEIPEVCTARVRVEYDMDGYSDDEELYVRRDHDEGLIILNPSDPGATSRANQKRKR